MVEFLQGYLGTPVGGFPEPLRSRVLKGAPIVHCFIGFLIMFSLFARAFRLARVLRFCPPACSRVRCLAELICLCAAARGAQIPPARSWVG